MDSTNEEFDRDLCLAVQQRPDGDGLRQILLFPGSGWRELPSLIFLGFDCAAVHFTSLQFFLTSSGSFWKHNEPIHWFVAGYVVPVVGPVGWRNPGRVLQSRILFDDSNHLVFVFLFWFLLHLQLAVQLKLSQ